MNDPSEVTWSAMRRYELRRWLASRQAGVKAWPSSKVGGWRLGCGPVGAFLPPCRDRSGRPLARGSTAIWSACWQPWLWRSWGDHI